MATSKTRHLIAEQAYQLGRTNYSGYVTQGDLRSAALKAMVVDRRLRVCLHSPALGRLYMGRFMVGWRDAEREHRAAAYQADLARLKAALAD